MNLIELNSVGCVIDENGVTYPMLADGLGIDNDGACHINDITNDEFFDALSDEDCAVVNGYLNMTKPTTEVDYLEMKAELAMGI